MRPPITPTPYDDGIQAFVRKLFKIMLLVLAVGFAWAYWEGRCDCQDLCVDKGLEYERYEMVFGHRFMPEPDLCECVGEEGIEVFNLM